MTLIFTAVGTVVKRVPLTARTNATSGALYYEGNINVTRSGIYHVSTMVGTEIAAEVYRESPFLLTVLPIVPAAQTSTLFNQGMFLSYCACMHALVFVLIANWLAKVSCTCQR
jgi:hypothetical protein